MCKRHAIGIAVCLALLAQQGIALAQSPDFFVEGCRDSSDQVTDPYLVWLKATCTSIIRTMLFLGRSHLRICAPERATVEQAIPVIVAYIDRRPERLREKYFEELALEALQRAWPCRPAGRPAVASPPTRPPAVPAR
jgi:Rap1a immunity proteins